MTKLEEVAKIIIEICDENIEIEGRGDDRYAHVTKKGIERVTEFLKVLKIPTRCPVCETLMIYQENDDLVCPNCGVVE